MLYPFSVTKKRFQSPAVNSGETVLKSIYLSLIFVFPELTVNRENKGGGSFPFVHIVTRWCTMCCQ